MMDRLIGWASKVKDRMSAPPDGTIKAKVKAEVDDSVTIPEVIMDPRITLDEATKVAWEPPSWDQPEPARLRSEQQAALERKAKQALGPREAPSSGGADLRDGIFPDG
jgi:hypothetical protein